VYTVPQEVHEPFNELVQLYLASAKLLTQVSEALKLSEILLFIHKFDEFVALTTGLFVSIFKILYDTVHIFHALSLNDIFHDELAVKVLVYEFHDFHHQALLYVISQPLCVSEHVIVTIIFAFVQAILE
jgi:hypothetical protein